MLGQKMAGHWASALQPRAGPSRAQRPGDILPLVSAGGTGGDRRWLGQEVAGTGLGTLGHGAARGVWNACVCFPDTLITSGQGAASQPLASVGFWWCGIYYCI